MKLKELIIKLSLGEMNEDIWREKCRRKHQLKIVNEHIQVMVNPKRPEEEVGE